MKKKLETRDAKDCRLCNLICDNSFKNFVACERVNQKFKNAYEVTLMEILECQWGYQLLDEIFDEIHETQWGYGKLDRVLEN